MDLSPAAVYQQRLELHRRRRDDCERRLAWLGNARFLLLVAGLLLAGPAFAPEPLSPWWLVVPAVAFFTLSIPFARARRQAATAARAAAFYQAGLARLADDWAGRGIRGEQYFDENHLYAGDLDLFGKGSLFERLCQARTAVGRDALARWLLAPAPPDEARARQDAIPELRDRLDWREELALLGGDVPEGLDTAGLIAWGATAGRRPRPALRWVARLLVAVSLAAIAAWWFLDLPGSVPLLPLIVQTV